MKYERLTLEYQFDCSRCENRQCTKDGFCYDETFCKVYNRLAELEDKIENGNVILPKYPLYSIVFIIDYINEKGHSVYGGKPIARECFVTCISQIVKEEGKLLYRVQPKDLPNDVLEGEVEHKQRYASAEKRYEQLIQSSCEALAKKGKETAREILSKVAITIKTQGMNDYNFDNKVIEEPILLEKLKELAKQYGVDIKE